MENKRAGQTFALCVLNDEGTSLKISLVESPPSDFEVVMGLQPADAREVSLPDGTVVALVDHHNRIVRYTIRGGATPGTIVLEVGASAFVREA